MALGPKYIRTAAREAWGPVNSVKQVVKGVWSVDTWGHGGYIVAVGPNEPFQLDPALQVERFYCTGYTRAGVPVVTYYMFEEDCDYAVLLAAHPEVREAVNRGRGKWGGMPISREDVVAVIMRWNPDFLRVAKT